MCKKWQRSACGEEVCKKCLGSEDNRVCMYVAHLCRELHERVVYQLRRRPFLVTVIFMKVRYTIISSGKEYFTI